MLAISDFQSPKFIQYAKHNQIYYVYILGQAGSQHAKHDKPAEHGHLKIENSHAKHGNFLPLAMQMPG
jgi:hypothetical protein